MTRERSADGAPTRRTVLRYGGAAVLGTSLAGCSGTSDSEGSTRTAGAETAGADAAAGATTAAETGTGTETDGASTESDGSHTVSMAPVGDVTFDGVPETWVANNGSWADMGVALGLEPPKALWLTDRYRTRYYDEIPGVSVDESGMVDLYTDGVSKELFYELDGDVHVIDPNFLINRFKGWKQSDVDEIVENVGPLFGNCIYAQHYPWHDYRYYTLYEGFEKLSKVFERTDRYEAFASLHEEFRSTLSSVVPAEGDRPSVAVLWGVGDEPEKYYPYVVGDGTSFKHFRDLKVRDALANSDVDDFHGSRAAIDLETLLEVDPPVLMLRGYEDKTREEFRGTVVEFLRNHSTASALTAVRNDDVYRAGSLYQGPITNLVLTERTARQLYGVEEELFDRDRVAAIVAGDV